MKCQIAARKYEHVWSMYYNHGRYMYLFNVCKAAFKMAVTLHINNWIRERKWTIRQCGTYRTPSTEYYKHIETLLSYLLSS